RSEEHTSELQSLTNFVCRLLLEKKKKNGGKDGRVRHRHAYCGGGGHIFAPVTVIADEVTILSFPSVVEAVSVCRLFFFNDTATTEIYTLSLHDALPISDISTILVRLCGAGSRSNRECGPQ